MGIFFGEDRKNGYFGIMKSNELYTFGKMKYTSLPKAVGSVLLNWQKKRDDFAL